MRIPKFQAINKKLALGSATALGIASIAAGAAYASIPGSNGVISACYNKKTGILHVIDAEAGDTCSNAENPLNWNTNPSNSSSGPAVHDSNGQLVGTLLTVDTLYTRSSTSTTEVYNAQLNRMVLIGPDPVTLKQTVGEFPNTGLSYASTDCSGQGYFGKYGINNSLDTSIKLVLYRVKALGGADDYGIVADDAALQNVTLNSYVDGTGQCMQTTAPEPIDVYPFTTVSLPFTVPLAMPLKF